MVTPHGMKGTREYSTWSAMIQRCNNPNNPAYPSYGGRGITVCDRWLAFANFFEDMRKRPSGYTIERRENDKGYSPNNCYWATWTQQNRNQRLRKDNTSGVRGVSWVESYGLFEVQINADKKKIWLGRFPTLEEAATARRQAEIKHWGK